MAFFQNILFETVHKEMYVFSTMPELLRFRKTWTHRPLGSLKPTMKKDQVPGCTHLGILGGSLISRPRVMVQVALVGGDSLLGQAIAEEFRLAGAKVCAIGTEEASCDVIIKG